MRYENDSAAMNILHSKCECYRHDHDDPLGQIPSSVKLEQLEAIFLLYQFIEWSANKGPKQIEWVRDKIRDNLGWTEEQFDACRTDAMAMYDGFRKASDRYLLEMPKPMILVPH